MRNLVYSVRYSVVPINSSLLTITLYSSVITTLVYNDTKYSVRFITFDCILEVPFNLLIFFCTCIYSVKISIHLIYRSQARSLRFPLHEFTLRRFLYFSLLYTVGVYKVLKTGAQLHTMWWRSISLRLDPELQGPPICLRAAKCFLNYLFKFPIIIIIIIINISIIYCCVFWMSCFFPCHLLCNDLHQNIFFFFFLVRGPRSWCYGRTAALRLIVQPLWWIWRWAVFLPSFTSNGAPVEWNWQGKTDSSEKNLSQCLCPSQISHGLDLGSNPGLRGERPATNRLSHGTACTHMLVFIGLHHLQTGSRAHPPFYSWGRRPEAVEAWPKQLISNKYWGKEFMELCVHPPPHTSSRRCAKLSHIMPHSHRFRCGWEKWST
jgi:hypothetical protein